MCGYAPIGTGPENQPPPGPPTPPDERRLVIPDLPVWAGPEGLEDFSLASPAHMCWFSMLSRASYAAAATGMFQAVARCCVSLGAPITFVANTDAAVPGFGGIELNSCNILVVSGTTNQTQWFNQLLNTNLGPTGFPPAAPADGALVPPLYLAAAAAISAAFPQHLAKPTIYIGDSMGGAIAEILWHKARRSGLNGGKCLTFGAPKPGNEFLRGSLPNAAGLNKRLARDGDFVPQLPPDLSLLNIVSPPAFAPTVANWSRYQHPGRSYILGSLGTVTSGDQRSLPLAIVGLLVALAAGQTINPIADHVIRGYSQTLRLGFNGWAGADVRSWSNPSALDSLAQQMTDLGV